MCEPFGSKENPSCPLLTPWRTESGMLARQGVHNFKVMEMDEG